MKNIVISAPILLGAAAATTTPSLLASTVKDESKPNIIFIMADDMGYECIGAYGGTYKTPNIDRLAEQGVMFNYAYAQPLSTPTRVQLMTGKYNHKNYVEFGFLNQDQKTFGHLAQAAGYVTCIVGKWQLGANPKLPAHFGFDNYCLWQLNYRRTLETERYANPLLEADGKLIPRHPDMYGPDNEFEYVSNFIDTNKDKPFLLYYTTTLVHDPFVSTPLSADWNTNLEGRHRNDNKYFADMMEHCDLVVGRLIDKLKKEGLYENTLIVFTADNGTNVNLYSTMKDGSIIQGGKGSTTDAGTRVPFIVTYGSRQGPARICNDLVDFTDVLPTMAQVMGVSVPNEWDTDGTSFLPQVMGQTGTPRKWAFCHYDQLRQADRPDPEAKRYIRDHRYKLYSTGEFYDIQEDVFEKNNILQGKGSVDAEKIRQFLASELAKFPAWKVGDIPVKQVIIPGLEVKFVN